MYVYIFICTLVKRIIYCVYNMCTVHKGCKNENNLFCSMYFVCTVCSVLYSMSTVFTVYCILCVQGVLNCILRFVLCFYFRRMLCFVLYYVSMMGLFTVQCVLYCILYTYCFMRSVYFVHRLFCVTVLCVLYSVCTV